MIRTGPLKVAAARIELMTSLANCIRALAGLAMLALMAIALLPPFCSAQTGAGYPPGSSGGNLHQSPPPENKTTESSESDRTLVIAPRIPKAAPAPSSSADTSAARTPNGESTFTSFFLPSNEAATALAPEHTGPVPYLGLSLQAAEVRYLGQKTFGLEVVGVDPGSPAQRAGLRTSQPKSTVGATGDTASSLLGPVALMVDPLLEKAGQMGRSGDLIVAVDDQRVAALRDFREDLMRDRPGELVYLTIIRQQAHGGYRTLKIPVKLAAPRSNATRSARAAGEQPAPDANTSH